MGRILHSQEARQTRLTGDGHPGYPCGQLKAEDHVRFWQGRDVVFEGALHRENITA